MGVFSAILRWQRTESELPPMGAAVRHFHLQERAKVCGPCTILSTGWALAAVFKAKSPSELCYSFDFLNGGSRLLLRGRLLFLRSTPVLEFDESIT